MGKRIGPASDCAGEVVIFFMENHTTDDFASEAFREDG